MSKNIQKSEKLYMQNKQMANGSNCVLSLINRKRLKNGINVIVIVEFFRLFYYYSTVIIFGGVSYGFVKAEDNS